MTSNNFSTLDENVQADQTLKSLICFHQQVTRLAEAGIPVECGSSNSPFIYDSNCKRLSQLTQRLKVVKSVNEFMEDRDIPRGYRDAARLWIAENRVEALNRLTLAGESRRFSRELRWFLATQVLLIVGTVILGLVFVCLYLLPYFESLQEQSHREAGPALRVLKAIGMTLPGWATVVSVFILFVLVYRKRIRTPFRDQASDPHLAFALASLNGMSKGNASLPFLSSIAILACGLAVLAISVAVLGPLFEIMLNSFGA